LREEDIHADIYSYSPSWDALLERMTAEPFCMADNLLESSVDSSNHFCKVNRMVVNGS